MDINVIIIPLFRDNLACVIHRILAFGLKKKKKKLVLVV